VGTWSLVKDSVEYQWALHRDKTLQKMDPTKLALTRLTPILTACRRPETLNNVAFAKRLRRSLIDVPIDENLNIVLRMIHSLAHQLELEQTDTLSIVTHIIEIWGDQVLYIPSNIHYQFWTRLMTKSKEPYYQSLIAACLSLMLEAPDGYQTTWHDQLIQITNNEDLASATHCADLFIKTSGKLMFLVQALYILIGLLQLEAMTSQRSYTEVIACLLTRSGTCI